MTTNKAYTRTPGPWTAHGGGKGSWIKGSNGEWAAMSCGETHATADENARLIAAAPDLLEALKEIAGNGDGTGRNPQLMVNTAQLAISKAESRS